MSYQPDTDEGIAEKGNRETFIDQPDPISNHQEDIRPGDLGLLPCGWRSDDYPMATRVDGLR